MIKYIGIEKAASAVQTIEKSKFIANIAPVFSKEEAQLFFDSVKKKYPDATHNVPAFVIGDKKELVWSSDDGEPGGTAGTPILSFLLGEGVTNVAVIVTRYFGGIKLGTGGLARAYSSSARMALLEAGKKEFKEYKELKIKVSYSIIELLKNRSKDLKYEIRNECYTDEVLLTLVYESENEESIIKNINEISCGKMKIIC